MIKGMTVTLMILFLFIPCTDIVSYAENGKVDVQEIIDKIDRLYRSKSSQAELEMKVATENWERTLTMDVWTEGMEKTFISITGPKKDKGIATLRIGTDMWNYFPKINKVMKVPPSMMMASWMGSDFTNDDLVKESSLREDYHSRLTHPDDAEPAYHYVELTPEKDTPTVWGKIIITIRKKDYIPVKEVYFDESGEKIRVLKFSDIKQFGDRNIPSVLEMIPFKKEDRRTVVRYRDIEFDKDPGDDVFTLRNLRTRR